MAMMSAVRSGRKLELDLNTFSSSSLIASLVMTGPVKGQAEGRRGPRVFGL